MGAKGREFADGGSGEPANFRRRHLQQRRQFRQRSGIGAAAQSKRTLHSIVVELAIDVAVHCGKALLASASASESAWSIISPLNDVERSSRSSTSRGAGPFRPYLLMHWQAVKYGNSSRQLW